MNNSALFISTLSSLALVAGAALADEKTYDVSGFDAVSVSAGIKAEITVGADYSVRAESSAEGLDRLEIRVSGSELRIGREHRNFSWRRNEDVTVYVSLPALSALDVSSGAQGAATSIEADDFAIDASSGGHAELAGTCKALNIDVSSGAHVDAEDLQCASARADASSGAHAAIFASESIVADASSGGHVEVYGSPKNVNIDHSSGGSVSVK
jgi:hypothetical protein